MFGAESKKLGSGCFRDRLHIIRVEARAGTNELAELGERRPVVIFDDFISALILFELQVQGGLIGGKAVRFQCR
ncbi:hypothetical protein GCM10007863_34120 [Dyella mobilis]|nr:hypothetical protein GCM10007863_34120 [Dyella mobilis]